MIRHLQRRTEKLFNKSSKENDSYFLQCFITYIISKRLILEYFFSYYESIFWSYSRQSQRFFYYSRYRYKLYQLINRCNTLYLNTCYLYKIIIANNYLLHPDYQQLNEILSDTHIQWSKTIKICCKACIIQYPI